MKASQVEVEEYYIDSEAEEAGEDDLQAVEKDLNTEMPDILKDIFSKKNQGQQAKQREKKVSGPFDTHKNLDMVTDSSNIKEEALKKAEALYQKLNVFKNIPVTAK